MTCKEPNCKKQAAFNFINETKYLYCGSHRKPDMINLKTKKCIHENCTTIANYNYITEDNGLYCAKHRLQDMCCIKNRCQIKDCKNIAYFNEKGNKKPLYCVDHCILLINKVNVHTKKCINKDCYETATYGDNNKPAKYCTNHKNELSVKTHKLKCKHEGCNKSPTYGIKNGKPEYCAEHCNKYNHIKLNKNCCKIEKCKTEASYGNINDDKPSYCATHCNKNIMHNFIRNYCKMENCKTEASYGDINDDKPSFCATHCDKKYMCNLKKRKTCMKEGCNKQPSYGNIDGKPLYCSEHHEPNMQSITFKKCIENNCNTVPTFNIAGGKPLYCKTHADLSKMTNVKDNRCLCCNNLAYYNIFGEKKALYCRDHSDINFMYHVKHKNCIIENCINMAIYNIKGDDKPKLCVEHRENDTYNVVRKNCCEDNCKFAATKGLLFGQKIHCAKHAKPNEIRNNNPKCIHDNCCEKPMFAGKQQLIPQRCDNHKEPADIAIVGKECEKCKLHYLIPADKTLCEYCDTHEKTPILRKEQKIGALLNSHKFNIISADKVIDANCSRRRPDFVIEYPKFTVVVECDENQHSQYSAECERVRMIQIQQDLGAEQVLFVRFNPDNYHVGNKLVKTYVGREKALVDLLNGLKNRDTLDTYLSVCYLFYDEYDGTIKIAPIKYLDDKKEDINEDKNEELPKISDGKTEIE